ncbi:MAG: SDR family oxidoreductase [Rhodospirillaceae bacterium]|jgi:3-oxoacyl-[acyl-carrier protein] reductase|nr:SDR family oxidoreductase [Rhodospirillaceae bacterium]MBT3931795.1 SDR family oxidoreductase [Rhodospirillaceae bacterium]MBT4771719.1 SDR family oxidoreductase [Rhodospirillaceae bacterium]MBT5357901.1 SDR family oxidoreductase [Rhodospirillaceae bacterium]MBT5768088.1 SDR family oxidoreductase [Rhodospirillaceae bacterium]
MKNGDITTHGRNRIELDGKIAIVTGAAQGIGRAIAERLLGSGADVWLWDLDERALTETAGQLGDGAHALHVDVSASDDVVAAAQTVADESGQIDILVNNAGISGANAPLWEYPVDEWRRVMEIDLNGVFYCCRAVVPHMIGRGYGRIVNMASVAGKEGNPNASAYSTAKAGVIALTKSLGKELAAHDIAVNCVTPAAARTALFDQMTQEHVDYMLSKIPRERFVAVEEIAGMVAWLVSAENSFTTAATFDLSGGRATY